MRLANKVAVITGAGSGMGKAMAHRFAAEGAHVICADISGKQNEVAAAIGAAAVGVTANVADEADVQNMIATAEQTFGRVDILVNNAGFGGGTAPLHEQTTENWDRVHSVNIRGVFFGMKYGVLSMLKTGGGAIVNISSASGIVGWKAHSIYGAAKAGVNQLTMRAEIFASTPLPRARSGPAWCRCRRNVPNPHRAAEGSREFRWTAGASPRILPPPPCSWRATKRPILPASFCPSTAVIASAFRAWARRIRARRRHRRHKSF